MTTYEGTIAMEGVPTDDGRMIDPDALLWGLPIPAVDQLPGDRRIAGVVVSVLRTGEEITARVDVEGATDDMILCGIEVADVEYGTTWASDHGIPSVKYGRISALTLYRDGTTRPAWPQVYLTRVDEVVQSGRPCIHREKLDAVLEVLTRADAGGSVMIPAEVLRRAALYGEASS